MWRIRWNIEEMPSWISSCKEGRELLFFDRIDSSGEGFWNERGRGTGKISANKAPGVNCLRKQGEGGSDSAVGFLYIKGEGVKECWLLLLKFGCPPKKSVLSTGKNKCSWCYIRRIVTVINFFDFCPCVTQLITLVLTPKNWFIWPFFLLKWHKPMPNKLIVSIRSHPS